MQSVIGKCLHIAQCSKPARLFVNNLLNDLREMKQPKCVLSDQSREDLLWFKELLPEYNGVHFFTPPPLPSDLQVIIGVIEGRCYAACGGEWILTKPECDMQNNTSNLFAVSALIAVFTWAEQWSKHTVNLFIPSSPTLDALQSGGTKNKFLQKKVWKVATLHDINLWFHQALYIPTLEPRSFRLSVPSKVWQVFH